VVTQGGIEPLIVTAALISSLDILRSAGWPLDFSGYIYASTDSMTINR